MLSVLIIDAEYGLTLDYMHCLTQVKNVKVYTICNEKNNNVKYSRYIEKFLFYPKTSSDVDVIKNINYEVKKNNIDLIVAISEYGIRFLIENKMLLNYPNKIVLLPELSYFDTANSKGLFAKHLQKFNIPAPKSILVQHFDSLDLENFKLNFPVLAKPIEGPGGGAGIILIKNINELKINFIDKKINSTYIIQEYIEGYDLGCNVLCKEGIIIEFTIQKGYLWNNKPFSYQIGLEFIYNEQVIILVKKLVKSLKWSGVANIDLRYDIKDDMLKVIEINPRYWGTLFGSYLSGVNFPYDHYMASINRKILDSKYRQIKYLTLQGFIKTLKNNIFIIFQIAFIWHNTPFKFIFLEPKLTVVRLFKIFKRFFNSLF